MNFYFYFRARVILINTNMKDNRTFACVHDYHDNITMLITQPAKINYIILSIVIIATAVVSTILILLFLLVIYRYKKLRNRANLLLMMLSISDLITSVFVLPIYSVQLLLLLHEIMMCEISKLLKMVAYISTIMSIAAITLITFNLYIGVVKPYYYNSILQTHIMIKVLIVIWIICTVLAVVSMYAFSIWKAYVTAVNVIALVLFVVMCCLHIRVSKETRKITDVVISPRVAAFTIQRKTLQLASTVLIIFVVVYLPSIVLTMYQMVEGSNSFIKTYIDRWFDLIALTNPLWNSLLYCYRLSAVRKRLSKVLLCGKEKVDEDSSNGERT